MDIGKNDNTTNTQTGDNVQNVKFMFCPGRYPTSSMTSPEKPVRNTFNHAGPQSSSLITESVNTI